MKRMSVKTVIMTVISFLVQTLLGIMVVIAAVFLSRTIDSQFDTLSVFVFLLVIAFPCAVMTMSKLYKLLFAYICGVVFTPILVALYFYRSIAQVSLPECIYLLGVCGATVVLVLMVEENRARRLAAQVANQQPNH